MITLFKQIFQCNYERMANNNPVLGRLTKENQHFFLNQVEIPGIQSVNADNQTNGSALKFLGMTSTTFLPRGFQAGNVSTSSLMIGTDRFLPLTGDSAFTGIIATDSLDLSENFSFVSAYLTSYSSKYSFGNLPTIDMSAVVLGDMGTLNLSNITPTASDSLLKIPGPGCVDISISNFATNRVLSYDINLTVNRNPVFVLGNPAPIAVNRIFPIEVSCSFQLEVGKFTFAKMSDYPRFKQKENVVIAVKTFYGDELLTRYAFSGMELYSQNYSSDVNGNAIANIQYRALLMP
jgi:hypothetical protein